MTMRMGETMKRRALIASLVAAATLALPALALAQDGPPPGTYKTKIATPPPAKGVWAISFVKGNGGTYAISHAGKIIARGHFLSIGPEIQLYKETGSKACKVTGYYNWKRTGKTLTFSTLSDPKCAARAYVLGHKFTLTA
jgi:hypothetical protein